MSARNLSIRRPRPAALRHGFPITRQAILALLLLTLGIHAAHAQAGFPTGEWGDAPDGSPAYPWIGVTGQFPTCRFGGHGYVFHPQTPQPINCWFGPLVDFEIDGNASLCVPAPYDHDECFADLDAGLSRPSGYTIDGSGNPVKCSIQPGLSLGLPCQQVRWSSDIEMEVHNHTGDIAYINVLFDWNQDGMWAPYPAGPSCGGVTISEHVIRNLRVPDNFDGLMSSLHAPNFTVGPQGGYVWARFTIANRPVPAGFNGADEADFDSGETEDYLLRVDDSPLHEFGDAPDGALAYPPSATVGNFPTCIGGSNGAVRHSSSGLLYLGPSVDLEPDGNAGQCSFIPYDEDECSGGGDGGLTGGVAWTIDPTNNYVACGGGPGMPIGVACAAMAWGPAHDLEIHNNLPTPTYLNLLVDWDHDGRWGGASTCAAGYFTPELALHNLVVPAGFNGLLSQLNPPAFRLASPGFTWARVTLGVAVVPADWDGSGAQDDGETEDYLLNVASGPVGVETGAEGALFLGVPHPSPGRGAIRFSLDQSTSARVRVTVHDIAGRELLTLLSTDLAPGHHELAWNGRLATGVEARSGLYFVRVESGGRSQSRRVVLMR
jgi:hypothetical protein